MPMRLGTATSGSLMKAVKTISTRPHGSQPLSSRDVSRARFFGARPTFSPHNRPLARPGFDRPVKGIVGGPAAQRRTGLEKLFAVERATVEKREGS